MKREISNEQSQIIPLLFFFTGLTIAAIITVLFFNEYSQFGRIASISLLLVLSLLSWYFATGFYTVSFDTDFLYFSRFGKTQKIRLEEVEEIKPWVFPFEVFYFKAYIITIIYQQDGRKKKIRFLSKGAFRNLGSIDGIPYLDKLRQYTLEKKHAK